MLTRSHAGAFVLGTLLTLGVGALAAPSKRPPERKFEKLDVFARVLSYVESNYVEEVDERKLVYGAVKGMMRTLDPHSDFMTPEEFADMRADTDGEFGGVGIEINDDGGVIVVVEPIAGSPAAKAGLLPGDRIIAIDGNPTKGRPGGETSSRLRGRPGTPVKLTVERKGWDGPHVLGLTRELIHVQAVEAKLLEPGIGYLRIKQFQERTDEEVMAALTTLKADSGGTLTGLVLDLRGNPGGLLDQAVKVSDLFLDGGVIVSTVGRSGKKLEEEVAREAGTWDNFPMVALVNGGSASASEIVAGALQDHGRALLIGTQTFGKGSVQSVYELADGSGLKLTVARYYTPSGRSIQEKGITPDVVVEQLDAGKLKDAKLGEAGQRERDLERHLKNLQVGGEGDVAVAHGSTRELLEHDYQLRTAFQTLSSWKRFQKLGGHTVANAKVARP